MSDQDNPDSSDHRDALPPGEWTAGFDAEKDDPAFDQREHRIEPGDGSTIPFRRDLSDDPFRPLPESTPSVPDVSPPEASYELDNPPQSWAFPGPSWHRVEKVQPNRAADTQAEPKRSREWLALMGCNLTVFVASVCVMVIELTASRLIAKHVGNSLYTWTSVIGVVLAGITIGNFLGGWLADRYVPERILSKLFLLASAACFSILWMDRVVYEADRPETMAMPTWVFLIVSEMFLLPALSLGTISPVVASIALKRSTHTGMTVGNVYAWGALGSIVGTFLAGFWLIDQFGTRMIIGGTASVLALIGAIVASKQLVFRTAVLGGWLQFLLVTTTAAAATSEGMGLLGESLGTVAASRDADVAALRSWYRGNWEMLSDGDVRTRLGTRCVNSEFRGLDPVAQNALAHWLRSGNRKHLDAPSTAAIEFVIDNFLRSDRSIQQWKQFGESLGASLHEVGVLLFLRSDDPGEYHDESNYSYINVRKAYDEDYSEELTELRLDKLVHSYFNPDNPTELYYEYELIYAELTERVTQNWNRSASTVVEPFDGLDALAARLPEWATLDTVSRELKVRGTLTAERRGLLLRLTPAGDYWLAIEELAEKTREAYWGGFSSVPLMSLPDGVSESKFLTDRLKFDGVLKTLNVFRELDAAAVDELSRIGVASQWAAWRDAVERLAADSGQMATFFIGGGGYVFPRWIEATFPGASRIDVAEIDPAVTLAVQKMMGLPPDGQTRVSTRTGDARNVVADLLRTNSRLASEQRPVVEYDFVYGDAFNDFAVPWHLTTVEFTRQVKQLLNPDHGVFLINVIDALPRTESSPIAAEELPPGVRDAADLFSDWQFAPAPLDGLEIEATGENEYRLGVRGVLSPRLYSALRGSERPAGLHADAEELLSASQKTGSGRFLSSYVKTISEVFPNVYVFSTSHGTPFSERDTFVIAASAKPIALQDLAESGRHWDTPPFASLETDAFGAASMSGEMDSLMATSRGLILTDDYAPVDNLLRPVFADQE